MWCFFFLPIYCFGKYINANAEFNRCESVGRRTTIRYVRRTKSGFEWGIVGRCLVGQKESWPRTFAGQFPLSGPVCVWRGGAIRRVEYVIFRDIRRRASERRGDKDGRSESEKKKKGTFVMGLDWNVCIQNVSLLRVSFPDLSLHLAAPHPPQTSPFSLLLFRRTRWPRVSSGGLTPRGAYATNVF